MEQIEFNLLEEPWIRVMKKDCTIEECSLTQALLNSHEYLRLSGELPTQDVAILRLLLAVLHTVFYRVDTDGQETPIEDEKQALGRWCDLWQAKRLPQKPICEYLEQWKDRFWLFHPEHPFYQVPAAERGTKLYAEKLNGEITESKNKLRLFAGRTGENKITLSYAEAARWLLALMGFDDAASVKKEMGTGAGWLGQHVNLYVTGENLFETLLLNLVFLKDGQELWDENTPIWEKSGFKEAKKREIAVPNNQAELLTLQSRRVLLHNKEGIVDSYWTTGGDFFGEDGSLNAFNEQMTRWIKCDEKKNQVPKFVPAKANAQRQMWRDFETVVRIDKEAHSPGIVLWLQTLKRRRKLEERTIHLKSIGVIYDSSNASVQDVVEDHLEFHAALLDEAGALWVKRIGEKITQTDCVAKIVGEYAEGLSLARGERPSQNNTERRAYNRGMQLYYAAVDLPFRKWLSKIGEQNSDDQDTRDQLDLEWRKEAYQIAMRIGADMANSAGKSAFTGQWLLWSPKGKNETARKAEVAAKLKGRMAFMREKGWQIFYSTPTEMERFSKALQNCLKTHNIRKEAVDE